MMAIATGAQLQAQIDERKRLIAAAEPAPFDPKADPVTRFVRVVSEMVAGVNYQAIEYDTILPNPPGKDVAVPRRIVVEPHQDGCHTDPVGRYIAELLAMNAELTAENAKLADVNDKLEQENERQRKIIETLQQQSERLGAEVKRSREDKEVAAMTAGPKSKSKG